jgi:DNA-binding SARP family transcriptional activator
LPAARSHFHMRIDALAVNRLLFWPQRPDSAADNNLRSQIVSHNNFFVVEISKH